MNDRKSTWLLDLHLYGGLVLVAAGASWVFPPAGVIVLGVGLIAFGRWI